jgi:polyhydroxyalkanoate synthesis regulator phasin
MATKQTKKKTENKKEDRSFVVKTTMKMADACTEKFKTYNEKYFSKHVDNGRDFFKMVEKDARKKMDDLLKKGKQYKKKVPMLEKMESRVTDAYNTVKSRIDLPTKEDIDKLTASMDSLTAKVDELNKKYTAQSS